MSVYILKETEVDPQMIRFSSSVERPATIDEVCLAKYTYVVQVSFCHKFL